MDTKKIYHTLEVELIVILSALIVLGAIVGYSLAAAKYTTISSPTKIQINDDLS